MKTAIYIEDGTVQLVITPESKFEKNALSTFQENPLSAKLFEGSFYDCRGGWVRQAEHYPASQFSDGSKDKSLILSMRQEQSEAERQAEQSEIERLTNAIKWALGEVGDFSPPADAALPPYWWRIELRKRSGL